MTDIDHEAAERIARDLGKTYQWPGDEAVRLVFAAYLDALEKLRERLTTVTLQAEDGGSVKIVNVGSLPDAVRCKHHFLEAPGSPPRRCVRGIWHVGECEWGDL